MAAYPKDNLVRAADVVATIYHLLGVDPRLLLANQLGRPMPICEGEVIRAMVR